MKHKTKIANYSLPVKLSIYISSLLMILFIAAASILSMILIRKWGGALQYSGITAARETAANLDRIFSQAEQVALLLSHALERRVPDNMQSVNETLKTTIESLEKTCPEIVGICIAYGPYKLEKEVKYNAILGFMQDGRYKHNAFGDDKFQYFFRDWYLLPEILQTPVWCVPFRSEAGLQTMLLAYSVPIYHTVGNEKVFVGVVVVDIAINRLRKHMTNFDIDPRSQTLLMSQFGQIVIHPNSEVEIHQSIYSLNAEKPNAKDRETARKIFGNDSGVAEFEELPLHDGPSQMFYARALNNWIVGVSIPADWVKIQLIPVFWRFMACWIGFIALVVVVIFVVSRRLNKPLADLSRAAESIGRGNFSTPLPKSSGDDEIGRLTASFKTMQLELTNYIEQLKSTVANRERIEAELNVAKAIQQDILPKELPPFEKAPNIQCAATIIPAKSIGGDLYDVMQLDEHHVLLAIGDVSGKGIPAALFMAITQTLHRNISSTQFQVNEMAQALNRMLNRQNNSSMFVTAWMGILNIETGELHYTNAGHNPPLCRRAHGEVIELKNIHGPALAALEDVEYGSSRFQLYSGDKLVLYTDGITEAFDEYYRMFGLSRLIGVVEKCRPDISSAQVIDEIVGAVTEFVNGNEQSDDITMLISSFSGFPAQGKEQDK